jgi:ATP/ADP translocase
VAILASILAIVLPIVAVITFVLFAAFIYWSYKAVRHLVRRSGTQRGATNLRR